MCFQNFASDDAWEKHWERKNPRGEQCLNPDNASRLLFEFFNAGLGENNNSSSF
jgi:hypothetical protein